MIIVGDCRKELQRLPRDYVQTVCTSPPYYGQRDYDIDGQIGRDQSLNEYIADIVDALSAVRGVLKPDGTVWLNIGDTYASSPPGNKTRGLDKWKTSGLHGAATSEQYADTLDGSQMLRQDTVKGSGRKPKNLLMVPARVAIALQDDGWILRSDIIWAKSSCLPESVRDRPTRSHEYVFLLAKSQKYKYNADAIKTPSANPSEPPANRRTVWRINPQSYRAPDGRKHPAAFPEALVDLCVKAGSGAGDTVLDPFCGSGTVGVVCKRLGRSFIGVEINDSYADIATKRIAAA